MKCNVKLKSEIAGFFIQKWIVRWNLVMLFKISVLATHPRWTCQGERVVLAIRTIVIVSSTQGVMLQLVAFQCQPIGKFSSLRMGN